ncbi:hypothetical protein [Demequina soli]|uniref:hypothetical protein n=1 Tax=Demequina soli TaxID=1638987 RepID=UPI000B2EC6D3|nr:hypothetical protein [Demequina soli]
MNRSRTLAVALVVAATLAMLVARGLATGAWPHLAVLTTLALSLGALALTPAPRR